MSNKKLTESGYEIVKGSLDYQKSKKFWLDLESGSNKDKIETFLTMQAQSLQAYNGYTEKHIKFWDELAANGVVYTARAKLWGQLNTRHEESPPKGIDIPAKSVLNGSACYGHLIRTNGKIGAQIGERANEAFKFHDANDGGDSYVTFERQTNRHIEAQIAEGTYTIVRSGQWSDQKFYRIIQDMAGDYYIINYADFKNNTLLSWGDVSPKSSRKMLESKSSDDVSPKFVRSIIMDKIDSSVKLLRFNWDEKFARDKEVKDKDLHKATNYEPHIACNILGMPIRGDVDLQNSMLPSFLPVEALRYTKSNTCKGLTDELQQLLIKLKSTPNAVYFQNLVETALKKLNSAGKDNDKVVTSMGVINVMNAAILIVKSSDVLHGSEAGSPVMSENICVTHSPNLENKGKYSITHSEFEYLKLLHNKDSLTKGRTIDFNPCWFVGSSYENNKGKQTSWRKDQPLELTIDKDGLEHPCENKTQERYNIVLWRMLFEKHLHEYRLENPNKFDAYVAIIKENWKTMYGKIKLKDKEKTELQDMMLKGAAAVDHLFDQVQKCSPESSKDEIRAINAVVQYQDDVDLIDSLRNAGLVTKNHP